MLCNLPFTTPQVPSPFKPRFRKFLTGSFRLRIGIISLVRTILVLIGGHFGGRNHFDGGIISVALCVCGGEHFDGGIISV